MIVEDDFFEICLNEFELVSGVGKSENLEDGFEGEGPDFGVLMGEVEDQLFEQRLTVESHQIGYGAIETHDHD